MNFKLTRSRRHNMKRIKLFIATLIVVGSISTASVQAGVLEDVKNASILNLNMVSAHELTTNETQWYKFQAVNGSNDYTITITGISDSNLASASAYIYSADMKQIGSCRFGGISYYYGTTGICYLNFDQAGDYYIKIVNGSYDLEYTCNITTREDKPNSRENAEKVELDTLYSSNLHSQTDTDWYTFKTGSDLSSYQFNVTDLHSGVDSGCMKYAVYDKNMKEVYCKTLWGEGEFYSNSDENVLDLDKNSTYYISFFYNTKEDTDYTFKISELARKELANTPTIKSVSPKKKGLTVKFGKLKDAKSYQVRYSTNYDMSGAKKITVKGTTAKLEKLKSNKNYYVQVRGIAVTKANKKIYSDWSYMSSGTVK